MKYRKVSYLPKNPLYLLFATNRKHNAALRAISLPTNTWFNEGADAFVIREAC